MSLHVFTSIVRTRGSANDSWASIRLNCLRHTLPIHEQSHWWAILPGLIQKTASSMRIVQNQRAGSSATPKRDASRLWSRPAVTD